MRTFFAFTFKLDDCLTFCNGIYKIVMILLLLMIITMTALMIIMRIMMVMFMTLCDYLMLMLLIMMRMVACEFDDGAVAIADVAIV